MGGEVSRYRIILEAKGADCSFRSNLHPFQSLNNVICRLGLCIPLMKFPTWVDSLYSSTCEGSIDMAKRAQQAIARKLKEVFIGMNPGTVFQIGIQRGSSSGPKSRQTILLFPLLQSDLYVFVVGIVGQLDSTFPLSISEIFRSDSQGEACLDLADKLPLLLKCLAIQ